MRHKWADIRRPSNPANREGTRAAISASLWLGELRRQARLTQAEMAERLGTSQSWISQVEAETGVRLSTVVAYIAALGGRLRLRAELPAGEVDLAIPPATTAEEPAQAPSPV
jgi:transcriptional regulator with XRE-family HTH domain